MKRVALLVAFALAVAACSAGSPSPGPTASVSLPTSGPPTPDPTTAPTSTPRPTPTPVPPGEGLCPTSTALSPFTFVESDMACFAGKSIEIRGWMEGPPSLGFEGPGVEPSWLYYPTDFASAIWDADPVDPDEGCQVDGHHCAWFFLHVDPANGPAFETRSRWVIVTGHVDDPAAATCHFVYPDDWTEGHYDDQDAVASCRTHFVLESIRDAP